MTLGFCMTRITCVMHYPFKHIDRNKYMFVHFTALQLLSNFSFEELMMI